ncbi:MAG: hypothetical protein R3E32_06260 [Chitinophagales bacterium]
MKNVNTPPLSVNYVIKISLLFFIFSIFTIDSYAQKGCGDDCGGTWSSQQQIIIPAPNYPNCDIAVFYRTKQCVDNSVQVDISGWGLINGNCDAFMSTFITPWPAVSPITIDQDVLAQIDLEVMRSLGDQLFIDTYNQLPTSTQQTLHCPQYNPIAQINFELKSCISYCISYDRDNPGIVRVTKTPCSETECCIIKRQHCFNTQTGQVEALETVTTVGNPACGEGTSVPTCNLPSNHEFLGQTRCTILCGDEE